MPQELTTQEQFDAFADDVARELNTHCRTAPLPEYARGLARLIVDGDGRTLRLCQPDDEQPSRLKVYAALPDEAQVQTPSIRVTAISAHHVAREITRRLYLLHAEAAELAGQIAARQQAEAGARAAVAEAVAGALPGARIEEEYRRTRIIWQHDARPPGQQGPVRVDSVCVIVGASGESVSVEASGRPARVISMLAGFARPTRE
ncbi:hypothetical protein [Streptomyces sp. CoT10]|uniref:hypothetical protein n=1 Tax=Streptomyces sp. CoT10 TaxID=2875762 RepID=UPI001CD308A9|nr:hypothetical protein [Streptomyces sp. CoT10]